MCICFSLIRYYWLTGLIWCCWIMSVIVFPISELIANSLHNEPHSSHTSRMNLCANCSCNHFYVNCCIELHSIICVRIVSILQKNTQTLKQRQTDEHMNESASVLFSITQMSCSHSLCRSGRQFPLSSFHSLLKTLRIEHAWHLINPWLLFASVPPFRFVFPLWLDKSKAFMRNINKTQCRENVEDIVWKISLCGEEWIIMC